MNYFSHQSAAERYAKYRLYYHPLVIERIRARLGLTGPVAKALDVACGTGLSAVALSRMAKEVLGVESAAEMLAQAKPHPHVSYRQGAAEELPVGDAEFDVLTVAQAFHWFDQERFLREAQRVVRPGGWLVIYGLGFVGKLRENAEFGEWFRNEYLRRYPNPPQDWREFGPDRAQAYGFVWHGDEPFGHDEVLGTEQFVGGLLTQSNVIAAVEQGGESLADVADWLMAEVGRLLPNGTGTFVFGGHIWYAQRSR